MSSGPHVEQIVQAYNRIKQFIHKTPVITSHTVDALVGKNVFFKCENFQKTGSFKARGAMNAVLAKLDRSKKENREIKGCVTHSSGNHGQALAWASKTANIGCSVVIPKGTPDVKIKAIETYGGKVVICEPTPVARVEACQSISTNENRVIIPPYDDYDVICGQGTIAIELLDQVPDLDCILVPVSGGGMISGIATYAKAIKPSIKIFAVEPEGKILEICLKNNERAWPKEAKFLDTKAEGIRLQQCGNLTFPIMCELVEKEVFTQSDKSMIEATRFMFERLKVVIELASGAAVAAALSDKMRDNHPELKNVGVILCGGNIDVDNLPWYNKQ